MLSFSSIFKATAHPFAKILFWYSKTDLPGDIHLIMDDHLGDTVIATVLLQSLRAVLPKARLHVYTKNRDLLEGLSFIDTLNGPVPPEKVDGPIIDLRDYVAKRQPQTTKPYRHLAVHQREIAEAALGFQIPKEFCHFRPSLLITPAEEREARAICAELAGGKRLIWIQTRTSETKKDWPDASWDALRVALPGCAFVDLSAQRFSKKMSAVITKFCDGGITLDTYGLHASQAVDARNVIAIMISSQRDVVCYPDQTVLGGPGLLVPPKEVAAAMKILLANPHRLNATSSPWPMQPS